MSTIATVTPNLQPVNAMPSMKTIDWGCSIESPAFDNKMTQLERMSSIVQ